MTNIALDDQLVADTMRLTGLTEESEAVAASLRVHLQLKNQAHAIESLWGSFDWQGDLEQSRLSRDSVLSDDDR